MIPGFVQYLASPAEPRLGDAWMAAQTFHYKTYDFEQSTRPGFGQALAFDEGLLVHLFGDPSLRLPCAPVARHDLVPVDLQPWANQKLADDVESVANLDEVPRGKQDFGGIRFNIGDKLIRLGRFTCDHLPTHQNMNI